MINEELRDTFAAAALSGLAAVRIGKAKNITAQMAWELADEMLAERSTDTTAARERFRSDPRYRNEP